jgi:phosphoglycerate dehydrogenase-like enzyme
MKPTGFLINAARGAIVDEAALCKALAAGEIAGAGLDVFAEDPLPRPTPCSPSTT